MKYFETRFLEEVDKFLETLDRKIITKILYNIDLAEKKNDTRLFKKLNNDIWEFRTICEGKQIRLLAFWDKRDNKNTFVFATHGFIKKTSKIPSNEIERAIRIRVNYFENI